MGGVQVTSVLGEREAFSHREIPRRAYTPPMKRAIVLFGCAIGFLAGSAHADGTSPALPERGLHQTDEPTPQSLARKYWQVGVSFAAEFVAFAGPICNQQPCILGSGGGIAARAGIRSAGPFYLGLAYEFSKQDASQIYRLAILQQLRMEGRFYFLDVRRDTQPYLIGSLGGAAYGNEWSIDTGGPAAGFGIGTETQISTSTVFGLALTYRALYTAAFFDGAHRRSDGPVQMFGLELVLEGRDPF